ncbi:MAG: 4-alpha-glucanotransferase, partial [Fidelibacterota bacterium]
MGKINFIFGIHCHQPVGNFDHIFEEAYRKSYLPFVSTLEKFSRMKVVMHFSGCLLEWLELKYPRYLERIRRLVESGRVEILTGGFFEPIIPIIPEEDAVDQIKYLTRYIKRNFNYDPKGMWLTERVWEPHIAKPIADAGVQYLPVDDHHF